MENDVIDSNYSEHTGGTQTPTCTTGKTCEKCGAEYGILGHKWGDWTPNYNGTHGTHTRRCTRCDKEETESCSGGATCTSPGVCATCGGSYYGGHKWVTPANSSLGNGTHRIICLRCGLNSTANCTGGIATCTAKAVCVVCGGEYGKLAPHQLVTIDRPATCQKEGLKYTYCAACRYRTPNIITPIQPHDLKKAREFTREPTCTKRGWKS